MRGTRGFANYEIPAGRGEYLYYAPSVAVLKKRLMGRQTETEEQTAKRIETALGEMKLAEHYNYLVINDVLEDAVDTVCSIIATRRASINRNINTIHEVLENA